ncbi:hypothetical protein PsorP6_014645 [Peronosclerospora sorghi]|uniref:Uncharacterized protein n=1 Tax=Peronosclerospora sorghi TaxID=230839 RepID=A0ACC0VTT1_9STRA|nr:hypothetical protein PsorP6_014645 [Peronosclerospora sorghi]
MHGHHCSILTAEPNTPSADSHHSSTIRNVKNLDGVFQFMVRFEILLEGGHVMWDDALLSSSHISFFPCVPKCDLISVPLKPRRTLKLFVTSLIPQRTKRLRRARFRSVVVKLVDVPHTNSALVEKVARIRKRFVPLRDKAGHKEFECPSRL